MPSEIEAVAAEAWKATRDKADPEFAECAPNFRDKLLTQAVSVRDHGLPGGDLAVTEFDKKVSEILSKPAKAAAAKAKEK